jgi:hypothetical protein
MKQLVREISPRLIMLGNPDELLEFAGISAIRQYSSFALVKALEK